MKSSQIVIEVFKLPPPQRLSTIMEAWNKLHTGNSLRIINDHDPAHLGQVFSSQFPNQYRWEYQEQGPSRWVIDITKI